MPAITSANLANAIVKLVAADALPALVGNLVMGNLVNRDYEPVLAQAGDTVNIPIAPTLVANNLLEGGIVQTQNPNIGNAQIVLNTHAEATFLIPDVTKVLAVPDLLQLYMQPAVVAIAQKIESDLLGLYASFTANTPVGTAGTAITEAASTRRRRRCSRPRFRPANTSSWWSTHPLIRRCARSTGSASTRRRAKPGCAQWWMEPSGS
jgi:P22 coat protein - gene protein 5.